MSPQTLLFFFILLFALELIYFKIADRYNIIDHPNHRSSHTKITIRGGGIIFSIALFSVFLGYRFQYPYFIVGLLLISLVSFIDDIKTMSNRTRIICHFIAVSLLFYQLNMYSMTFYWIILGLIFVIGTINAINFMDGINGITGGYGLVALLTLYFIERYIVVFTEETYLIVSIISVLVFSFFNFRKKAKCFAGDVGSVSLAFIILFFLLQLIIKTNNINYILFLLLYGLDAVTTIFFRILRKENIFEAHRTHFYQFLANGKKIPHIFVSILYIFIQTIINILVINYLPDSLTILFGAVFLSLIMFLIIRLSFEGFPHLFSQRN
jgi:UDP-N-acetylmuramyl pentapeptide phosphotransferase/UDP-N-acetylglucosamine-1-phosphate transferase